jgi:hypothetical protein
MSLLTRIVDFLRVGYPEGVPPQDYIPLLALLRRQLTDEEVAEVARTVLGEDTPDIQERVDHAIRAITKEEPLSNDIARVAARLAAAGWPLAPLHEVAEPARSGS